METTRGVGFRDNRFMWDLGLDLREWTRKWKVLGV